MSRATVAPASGVSYAVEKSAIQAASASASERMSARTVGLQSARSRAVFDFLIAARNGFHDRVPLLSCDQVSAGGLRGEPGGRFVHRLDDREEAETVSSAAVAAITNGRPFILGDASAGSRQRSSAAHGARASAAAAQKPRSKFLHTGSRNEGLAPTFAGAAYGVEAAMPTPLTSSESWTESRPV
jgi:hypothetical protein